MICENFWEFFFGFSLRNGGRMNGMCCLGDSNDPGIRMCMGEVSGMNVIGNRSDISDDKGSRKNLAAQDSNSL